MTENVNNIFRFWTWKKFLLNFLVITILNLMILSLFEFIEFFKSSAHITIGKLIRDAATNSLLFSVFITIWSPEKEDIVELIKRKILNKKINK